MNTAVTRSAGSTQNAVLAAPPHANSPALPSVWVAAGSRTTAKPSPNPVAVEGCLGEQGTAELDEIGAAGQVVARHVPHRAVTEHPHPSSVPRSSRKGREAVVVSERRRETAAAGEPRRRAHGVPEVAGATQARRVQRREPIRVGGHGERRLMHAEGIEHEVGERLVERLAGDDLDQAAEHVGAHRVVPLRPRLEEQRHRREVAHRGGEIGARRNGPFVARGAIHRVDRISCDGSRRSARTCG